jgi:GGDEF domain-containing protein
VAQQVLDFVRTRRLLLLVGLVVIALTAVVMSSRGIDSIEVWATLLFMGVFVLAVFWGVPGGVVGAIAAMAVYLLLRAPSIEVLGLGQLGGALASRSASYLLFGAATGWAAGVVQRSLAKLDKHDVVDDATGLLNARGIAGSLGLESARARRYGGVFAVVTARIHLTGDRKSRREGLENLGDRLRFSLRTVDRVGRWEDDDHGDVLVVILPETPREGAKFVRDRIQRLLDDLEYPTSGDPNVHTYGWPDDADAIKEVERLATRMLRFQHPESEPEA